jgi:hypothetical protein
MRAAPNICIQGAHSVVRSIGLSSLALRLGGDLKKAADCEPGGRQMSQGKDAWEAFGIRIGPFGIDINSPGQAITHTRTETSHLLQIRIDPAVKKETIKARLVRPGLLEIEWPRVQGEEIRIE